MARAASNMDELIAVYYEEKTPQQAERLRKEQAEILLKMKLRAMQRRGEALPKGYEIERN